ncbi:cation:proton antiporter [Candidatus Micrarchaeota archaeon]|nr:cation:proton antiporter [Candidatus Micrarchaeota archaeon]
MKRFIKFLLENPFTNGIDEAREKLFKPLILFSTFLVFIVLLISLINSSLFAGVDPEKHAIFEIVFLLFIAILAETLVLYLKQPTVILLLVLGILIGPSFIDLIWPYLVGTFPFLPSTGPHFILNEPLITIFAQLGAIILMFKVGLHTKIQDVFKMDNALVAFLGVLVPFIVGCGYALITGGSFVYSLFLGAAFTATSVGVTVALLQEMGLIKKKFSQMIIGAAIIDDILSLLALSLIINLPTSFADLAPSALTFLFSFVFIIGGLYAGRLFIKSFIDVGPLDNKTFLYILSFVFFYAYFAEHIGLSSIVGAFIAGTILNQSKHIGEIDKRMYALGAIFIPIFFISMGMLLDVGAIWVFGLPILIITVLAVLSKLIGCGIGALLSGFNKRDSVMVGLGMGPRGEVSLIIALIGLSSGVLNQAEYTIISAMALLTTLVGPPLMNLIARSREDDKSAQVLSEGKTNLQ